MTPTITGGAGTQALRERILSAARMILDESDTPDGLTIRRLAERVGVSQPTIYVHFTSRDQIAGEVGLRARTAHDVETRELISTEADPMERIRMRLEKNLDWSIRNPSLYLALGFAFMPDNDVVPLDEMASMADAGIEAVVADIQELIDTGRVAGDDAAVLTGIQITFEHGFTEMILVTPTMPWGSAGALRKAYIDGQLGALAGAAAGSPEA